MEWDGAAARYLSAVGSERRKAGSCFCLALATQPDDAQIRILDPGRGWQNDPLRLVGGGEAVCIPSFGAHPRRVESDISMLVPCVPRQTVSTRPRNAPAHNIWRDMQYRSAILLAQKAQGSQLDGKKGGG